jgi:prevent-host-death family protein
MLEVNVHEAKTQFSKLLERVARGEEILIAKAGKPVARLVPLEGAEARVWGQDRETVRIQPDFYDCDDEVAALFNS